MFIQANIQPELSVLSSWKDAGRKGGGNVINDLVVKLELSLMGTNETGNIQKSFPKCHLVLCREHLTESREETRFMKKKRNEIHNRHPKLRRLCHFLQGAQIVIRDCP